MSVVQLSRLTGSHVDSELRIVRSRVQKKKRRPQRVVEGATTLAVTVMAMTAKRFSVSFSANTSWTHGTTGKPCRLLVCSEASTGSCHANLRAHG